VPRPCCNSTCFLLRRTVRVLLPQVVRGYEAVLTDFGSARAVPIQIGSRAEALTVQEDAEVGMIVCVDVLWM
jgi:hypothetical protein